MSDWLYGAARTALLAAALVLSPSSAGAETASDVSVQADVPVGTTVSAAPDDPFDDLAFDQELESAMDPFSRDPWEPANRVFFGLNQVLDTVLWDPVTSGYQFLVPAPGRRSIRRLFLNLNSPVILANDILQLRFKDAGETLGRFVLNTAVGAGGLFDAGKEVGWEAHKNDFGQTLALVGVKSGPYLVVPVFGPSTVRDGVGDLVDTMFQPLAYVLGTAPQLMIGTGRGLSTRDRHDAELEALESSSVDFYAALRSAYLQNRDAEIEARRRP